MISPKLSIAACLFYCCAELPAAFADQPATTSVRARSLEIDVPNSWVKKEATSTMRVAEYTIPAKPIDAEFVVFYFGGPTGGVKANVDRWISQFEKDGLKLSMSQGKCAAGSYILVDTQGTWNKPDGPPFARKTIATPNSRVVNVIIVEEKEGAKDYYFAKLSGHEDVVGKLTQVVRDVIAAEKDSEKPFVLKDAE